MIRTVTGMTAQRWTGAALLLILLGFGWGVPLLWPVDPAKQDLMLLLTPPDFDWADGVTLLGTDHLGRSLLTRLASAVRLSLGLALIGVVTAAVPGVLLGMVAGWSGGWVDRGLSLLADAVFALPGLLLVLLVLAIAPGSFIALYVGIALLLWLEFFRVVRAQVRRLRQAPAVQASLLLGLGPVLLVRRHLWPELAPVVLTLAAFGAAATVMATAALGFVSVGLRPPVAELGLMMTELLPYYEEAPWALAQPVAVMVLLGLSLTLLAGKDPR